MKRSIATISMGIFLYLGTSAQVQFIGMTSLGGKFEEGVIFKTDFSNTHTTVTPFVSHAQGANPNNTGLLQTPDGHVYGMTTFGGKQDLGVIFVYDPTTQMYQKKFDFDGKNTGALPKGRLLLASNGMLYGCTSKGGLYDGGVLFQFNPKSATFSKLFDFNPSLGLTPCGYLTETGDGNLYGLTSYGGEKNAGVIFKYNLHTAAYVKVADFAVSSSGRLANGALIQAQDGALYGLAMFGGDNNSGVLFCYNPKSQQLSDKVHFKEATSGKYPCGSVTLGSDGVMYGMTSQGGAYGEGAIFQYDMASNSLNAAYHFSGETGGNSPFGTLTLGSDGKLYGMTQLGGAFNFGTMFQFDPKDQRIVKSLDFNGSNGKYPGSSQFIELQKTSVITAAR